MYNFRFKLAAILTTAALGIAGLVAFAPNASAVVAFNTFPISYSPQTNHDFPMIDARNITAGDSFSASQAEHDAGVAANAGDEIEFEIYYHNSGVAEEQATNVTIRALLPSGSANTQTVGASISADQSGTVNSSDPFRGGNITVNINGTPQTLQFESGSVQWFPNHSTVSQFLSGADNLVSASGVNIGTVKGCFDFSGFLTFRARVGSQTVVTQNQDLNISKSVLDVTRGETVFQNSTTANSGDRVRFQIIFSLSGNASQSNVIVRDIMPANLSFVQGTEQISGVFVGSEFDLFGSGRNLGTLSAGTSETVIYDATVAQAGAFSNSSTFLTNTANVRSDQVATRQDDATVVVQVVAGVQFSLRKTAFNVTQGADATTVAANPGDVISYTLYYKNTGQTTIQNAVIQDDIHDVEELAQVSDQGGAVSVNSSIVYAPIDVPPGVEISRTFQVRVKDASLFPASSDLVMDNVYGNEIRVLVRKPQVQGVVTPPRTGASEWLVLGLAFLATAGYWVYRKRFRFGPQADPFE